MPSSAFFLQFPAGLDRLVVTALRHDLDSMTIVDRDDSSITIETTSSVRVVEALTYINNRFLVLGRVASPTIDDAIPAFRQLAKAEPRRLGLKQSDTFRLMSSSGGQLVPIPAGQRTSLERAISQRTGASVARRGLGVEFWFIQRRDSTFVAFARKLARRSDSSGKGSLSQVISTLLVRSVPSSASDVFLDPFGGSGAIALARSHFPARSIVSSDLAAPGSVDAARLNRAGVRVRTDDALTLKRVPDSSVDVIVTDPPWGEWGTQEWTHKKYATFVATAHRVLRSRGVLGVLISRRQAELLRDVIDCGGFAVSTQDELLVNGHPATLITAFRDVDESSDLGSSADAPRSRQHGG